MEDKILGTYRIRYKQETLMVPVTDTGVLVLPDGKRIQLSEERFAVVKEQLEQKAEELNNTWSLVNNQQKASAHQISDRQDQVKSSEEPRQQAEEKGETEFPVSNVAESEEQHVQTELTAADHEEQKRSKPKKERHKKEKPVKEKPVKEKPVKEKKAKQAEDITPGAVIVVVLASVLLTLLIITAMFLYFIGNGTIVVNPKWNGLVIYDDNKNNTSISAPAENTSLTSWNWADYSFSTTATPMEL